MNNIFLKIQQEESANHRSASESATTTYEQATAAATLMLTAANEDPTREGLERTPHRFAKAFEHLCSGYFKTAADVVGEGLFPAEGSGLVSVCDVEFYSLCEHHMLPFWGKASVAYYPGERILGLSKIPRLVDLHARRLQVQERITESVAADISKLINPRAIVVQIEAQHLCMMMRGVEKQGSTTTTEASRNDGQVSEPMMQRLYAALKK